MRTAAILFSCVLLSSSALAQTGTITPAPKLSDGKPDLTGVYQASPRRGEWDAEAPGDEPGVPAERRPINVVTGTPEPIPFRPEARAFAQDILNRRSIDDPTTRCLFASSPR